MPESYPANTRIEQHTIYPIPADERHGRAADLFTLWFGSNIMILTIVTGALATTSTPLASVVAATGVATWVAGVAAAGGATVASGVAGGGAGCGTAGAVCC